MKIGSLLRRVASSVADNMQRKYDNDSKKKSHRHSFYPLMRKQSPTALGISNAINAVPRWKRNEVTNVMPESEVIILPKTAQELYRDKSEMKAFMHAMATYAYLSQFAYREDIERINPLPQAYQDQIDFFHKNFNCSTHKCEQELLNKALLCSHKDSKNTQDMDCFVNENNVDLLENNFEALEFVKKEAMALYEVMQKAERNGFKMHIWRDPQNNELIFSFRGTHTSKDIASDLELGIDRFQVIEKELLEFTSAWHQKDPQTKFTYTGHSLGGGIAQICAYFDQLKHPDAYIGFVSFGGFGAEMSIRSLLKSDKIDLDILKQLNGVLITSDQDVISTIGQQTACRTIYIPQEHHPIEAYVTPLSDDINPLNPLYPLNLLNPINIADLYARKHYHSIDYICEVLDKFRDI